jgi:hypothetical protein
VLAPGGVGMTRPDTWRRIALYAVLLLAVVAVCALRAHGQEGAPPVAWASVTLGQIGATVGGLAAIAAGLGVLLGPLRRMRADIDRCLAALGLRQDDRPLRGRVDALEADRDAVRAEVAIGREAGARAESAARAALAALAGRQP